MHTQRNASVQEALARLAGIRDRISGLHKECRDTLRFRPPPLAEQASEAFLCVLAVRRLEEVQAQMHLLRLTTRAHAVVALPRPSRFGGRYFHVLPVSDLVPVHVTQVDGLRHALRCDRHGEVTILQVAHGHLRSASSVTYAVTQFPLDGRPRTRGDAQIVPCITLEQAEDWVLAKGGDRDRVLHLTERSARRYLPMGAC